MRKHFITELPNERLGTLTYKNIPSGPQWIIVSPKFLKSEKH